MTMPTDDERKAFEQALAPHEQPLPSAGKVLLVIVGVLGALLAYYTALGLLNLPFVADARTQLRYALKTQNVRLVEAHTAGQMCGIFLSTAAAPMRFLIENGQVSTGPIPSQAALQDGPIISSSPYGQWSRCMIYNRQRDSSRKTNAALAIWLLNILPG